MNYIVDSNWIDNYNLNNQVIIMKSITVQQNQQNFQKKYRKSYVKDYSKRPWKTPSPGLHGQLKSSRFMRNTNKDKERDLQKNQQQKNQYSISSKKKISRPYLQSPSQHYLAVKEAYNTHSNKMSTDEYETRSKRYLQIKQRKDLKKSGAKQEGGHYNHYFQSRSPSHKQIIDPILRLKKSHDFQRIATAPEICEKQQEDEGIRTERITKNNEYLNKNGNVSRDGDELSQNYSHIPCQIQEQLPRAKSSKILCSTISMKQYQQTIRRYNNENNRLKRDVKQYSSQCKELIKIKKQLELECEKYKVQVTQLSVTIYELKQQLYQYELKVNQEGSYLDHSNSYSKSVKKFNSVSETTDMSELEKQITKLRSDLSNKEKYYQQQLNSYKNKLENSEKQLNQSNLQIYKMKQQICQFQLQSQKKKEVRQSKQVENNQTAKVVKKNDVKQRNYSQSTCSKHPSPILEQEIDSKRQNQNPNYTKNSIKSNKSIQKNSSQKSNNIKKQQCQQCMKLSILLQQSIQKYENIVFDTIRQENIIAGLNSQIKNLDNQLRLLQKPKIFYKKFNNTFSQLNQIIVKQNLKQLNNKYKLNETENLNQSSIMAGGNSTIRKSAIYTKF